MTSSLPEGYLELRRSGVTVFVRAEWRDGLVMAGALDATPAEGLGRVIERIGGGRAPVPVVVLKGSDQPLVVKRVRRGGLLGPVLRGWSGRRRAVRELMVTEQARARGAPTPPVIAARVRRLTPLPAPAEVLLFVPFIAGGVDLHRWLADDLGCGKRAILHAAGAAVAALHRAGVDHEDLNLANLVIDPHGSVHVIDLGTSRIGGVPAAKARTNLARLYRSAVKRGLVPDRVSRSAVARFLRGYAGDAWRSWHRAIRRRYRATLWLHRAGWMLRR